MPEPNFSVNFTGKMVAVDGCDVGDALVYDSAAGLWKVATLANRAAAGASSQAIALTAYGGSVVGKVAYQSAGILAAEVSGIAPTTDPEDGLLARVNNTTGRLERCAQADIGDDDDVVGKCELDGRVHLGFGLYAFASGGTGLPDPGVDGAVIVSEDDEWVVRRLSLDDLDAAFNVTMSGAQTVEVGATVTTPAFTASYTGGPATSATLTDNDGSSPKALSSPFTSVSSDASPAKTANNASVTYTITANKGATVDTSSVTIAWRPYVRTGKSSSTTYNEALIESLTGTLQSSRTGSFTVNAGPGEHILYAAPVSYGTPVFFVGGFEGGYDLVATVLVTNSYGVAQNYQLWRTTNANLGNTTTTVT